MTVCYLDLEVFSELDVGDVGAYKVAEHDSTEILCAAYAFDDEEVQLWIKGQPCPTRVRKHIEAGHTVSAFNYGYEAAILSGKPGQKAGWPALTIRQGRCTAVQAREAGLPGSLGEAAEAMGTFPKDEAGRINMLQLTKPRRPSKDNPDTRYTPEKYPEKFQQLYKYNLDDTRAERALSAALPPISQAEMDLWYMDQEMNWRGVYVDVESIDNFLYLIAEYKKELVERCIEVTGVKPSQREQVANWVRTNGYPNLPNLQAETIKKIVKGNDCPEAVKEILLIYSTANNKAIMKFQAIKNAVCADGRVYGMFIFYGAQTTGRWSSRIVNFQSLFRPVLTQEEIDLVFEAIKCRDLDWIKMLFAHDPMKVFASCTRGVLSAAPGKKLISMDYAGIESRWTSWLFGEGWKIKAFEAQDAGTGPDMYVKTRSDLFQVPIESVTKKQRQEIKPVELAFGFEGGLGALMQFAETYGVDLENFGENVWKALTPRSLDYAQYMIDNFGRAEGLSKKANLACEAVKFLWREKHSAHKTGWENFKAAGIAAVQNKGETFGLPNKKVLFRVLDRWLAVLLPSGRKLRYFEPAVEGEGPSATCTYIGIDTDTRQFMRTHTYGGKWTQNTAEGGCRDLLCHGVMNLRAAGFSPIMLVHDEVVLEVDEDVSLEDLLKIYTRKPKWALDFPLAAEGYEAIRYRKD